MQWPDDFPDCTDDNEPDLPSETDVCRSELNAAEARVSRSRNTQAMPAQGLKEAYEHQ